MSTITLEESARIYLKDARTENGIPGDAWNNFALCTYLSLREDWPRVAPLGTYEDYLKEKFDWKPALVEEVLKISDLEEIRKFDKIVASMNEVIGHGVTTQEQADALYILLDDARYLIYGRRKGHAARS